MTGAVDPSNRIEWEDGTLRSLGLEVLAARLEHDYFGGWGNWRSWQLTASFVSVSGISATLPEFHVKLELCDATGAVIGHGVDEARTVGSRFVGQASAAVTASTRTKKAIGMVEYFIASVEPVQVSIPVQWNREAFEHAGISVTGVTAALVRDGYSMPKMTVRAALESRTLNSCDLQAVVVDTDGLPLPVMWDQTLHMAPTTVTHQFAGSTEWTHDGGTPHHIDLLIPEDSYARPRSVQRLGATASPSKRLDVTDLSATVARTSSYLAESTIQVAGVVRRSLARAVETTPDGIDAILTMKVVTTAGRVAGTYRHWVWLDYGPDECEGNFWVRFPIHLPDPEENLLEVRVDVT